MPLANAQPVPFLFTRDRARARAFYADVLGLRHTASEEHAECFDLAGTPLRIVPMADHVASPHTVLGWEVADIHATAAALAARGVTFEIYDGFGQDAGGIWTSPDGATRLAWFLDPDGNNLSISQHG